MLMLRYMHSRISRHYAAACTDCIARPYVIQQGDDLRNQDESGCARLRAAPTTRVTVTGLVPHLTTRVTVLGFVPHLTTRVTLLNTTTTTTPSLPPQHHHHHHPTAPPRAKVGGGGWRRGREGEWGCINCTPPVSARRADGGRSQDLESAPALNRAGREPATTSHRLNRCSGAQLSGGTAGSPQTRCARMRPGDCRDARIVRPGGVLVLHRTEGGTDRPPATGWAVARGPSLCLELKGHGEQGDGLTPCA